MLWKRDHKFKGKSKYLKYISMQKVTNINQNKVALFDDCLNEESICMEGY